MPIVFSILKDPPVAIQKNARGTALLKVIEVEIPETVPQGLPGVNGPHVEPNMPVYTPHNWNVYVSFGSSTSTTQQQLSIGQSSQSSTVLEVIGRCV